MTQRVCLTLAILAVWGVQAIGDEPSKSEAKAIQAVLDKQEADWNKGDLDAFLEGYWRSPGVVFQSGGDRNVGFDAMRDRYRKRYQAEGKAMGQVAFSEVEIELLSPTSALVRGRWQLTMPDGKKPGGLYTLIFRKFPEGWKIVHDHTSSAEPPPAPVRAPGASSR
jgi:beta-aspartyl-peptidase (threonine type)